MRCRWPLAGLLIAAIALACCVGVPPEREIAGAPGPAPAARESQAEIDRRLLLAKTIRDDADLDAVAASAEALMREGANAGSHYRQVWIRDFNTFIELALRVRDRDDVKDALVVFFHFQGRDGSVIDGFVPDEHAVGDYSYISSGSYPGFRGFRNSVESDQESSLVQAICRYVRHTGDRSILATVVAGETVVDRMARSLRFLLRERYSERHGLIVGATTADWGDVQPEDDPGVEVSGSTHWAIDVYDNAMLIIALKDYAELIGAESPEGRYWLSLAARIRQNVREHLWDPERSKFITHIYLQGSPFPPEFDESRVYFHGGTAVAIEAGVLTAAEVLAAYRVVRRNVEAAGAATIGLTIFPPYPAGYFRNPQMAPYSYQNGGDWDWFGARWVPQLLRHGWPDLAYAELKPMAARVVRYGGFYEWHDRNNEPRGSANFKGAAGMIGAAIIELRQWADRQIEAAEAR